MKEAHSAAGAKVPKNSPFFLEIIGIFLLLTLKHNKDSYGKITGRPKRDQEEADKDVKGETRGETR